jgi:hypothetical protein
MITVNGEHQSLVGAIGAYLDAITTIGGSFELPDDYQGGGWHLSVAPTTGAATIVARVREIWCLAEGEPITAERAGYPEAGMCTELTYQVEPTGLTAIRRGGLWVAKLSFSWTLTDQEIL